MGKSVLLLIPLFLLTTITYGQASANHKTGNPLQTSQWVKNAGTLQHISQPSIKKATQNYNQGFATAALQHINSTSIKKASQNNITEQNPIMPKAPNAWTSVWYFSQTPGTYTAITGGTVLGTTANDENVFTALSIGFTFNYNGIAYTQFSAATNGFIALGATVTTATLPLSAGTTNNVISALGMDLIGQTGASLQYKLEGTSPARTLVVQWTNYLRKGKTGDAINFQIRLNENNNSIVYSYGTFTIGATNSTAQVGIRGASSAIADISNRLVNTAGVTTWGVSIPGTANTSNCYVRTATIPENGQVYGWTPYSALTATLPLSENFDGVATGTLPVGWSVVNSNADAWAWNAGSLLGNSAPNHMYIQYNSALAMNDWFFSPRVSLTSGHTYKVTCYYMNDGGTTYPEKLEVKYGLTNTAAGMTSAALISNTAITGGYQLGSGTFVCTSTNNYYFGWHGFSAMDEDLLLVDDITISEVVTDDVGPIALINPTKLPKSQQMKWFGNVQNFGMNTETFNVATKLRENTVLSSTQTNTVTSLAPNATSSLNGIFNLATLGSGSSFDLSLTTLLAGDLTPGNDILPQYTRACTRDTVYAWDDGTAEGSIGYNTGSGWLGQLYYLSAQDTLTSVTVTWGTIPGALAGNSLEIYNVVAGLPTTKFVDIVTGISLTLASTDTKVTYKPSSPIILPAGTYWIGAQQSVALAGTYLVSDDQTGFTSTSFISGLAFYSSTAVEGSWTDYSPDLNMINLIRPNFANILVPFVANPTAYAATAVSSSEIDLGWALNGNGNNVLVAWSPTGTFGNPSGGAYVAGSTISGGGTVLQFNASTSCHHTSLSSNTQYFYKIWSYNGSIYSGGITANAQTFCAETPSPWSESFEATTFPPSCWGMNTGAYEWTYTTTASSYGTGTGSAFADFFNIPAGNSFGLFTLPFSQGSLAAPTLSFDYAYATFSGEVDEMDVFYSTDDGTTFTLLLAMPGGTSGILNTGGTQSGTTAAWIPTAAQWATKTLSLPAGTNMIAFNATSAYGNSLYLDNVKIIEGLLHDVGVGSLDVRDVYSSGMFSPVATVANSGGSNETFSVNMTIGTYTSTKSVTLGAGFSQQVTFDPWVAAIGDYTLTVTTTLSGDLNAANNTASKAIKVMTLDKVVYGYTTFTTTNNGPVTFNLNNPGTLIEIVNDFPATYPGAGTWANGAWYAAIYSAATPFNLVTFNTTTGARTVVGNMGVNINALSYNTANSIMYGAGYDGTNSSLYTINLTTGAATLVGVIGTQLIINMAINNAGVCYATDLGSSTLGTINLTSAAFTAIGSVGFAVNYAQDMEFDRETGELYMAAYGTTGELRWVNKTSGNTMLIGEFQGGAEVTGFAIPYSTNKTLNLTGVTLQGLYDGSGTMLQAMDENGIHWPAGVADHITVELHNAASYATIAYSADVALSTFGAATLTIPADKSGSYYITIKHRNSIETVSANAVSFAGSTVNQSFGAPADVYGGNLLEMIDVGYAIYGGDVNQDRIVDGGDMSTVENDANNAASGYLADDCNGDGVVDGGDMSIVENDATIAAGAQTP